jgi:hypothetical protein
MVFFDVSSDQNLKLLQKFNISSQCLMNNPMRIIKTKNDNQYTYTYMCTVNDTTFDIISVINISHLTGFINNNCIVCITPNDNSKYVIDLENKNIYLHTRNSYLEKYHKQLPLKRYNKNPNSYI